jgi:hypothetical protein
MELHERVSKIKTKQDLGQFIAALRADLATNPERWENPTLDRFLQAMEAWIADMEGYYKNSGQAPADPPTWKTFGDILIAAAMYE